VVPYTNRVHVPANHFEDLFKVYKKILTLCAVGELSRQSLTSSRRALLSAPYSPDGINMKDLDDILQHDDVTEKILSPESPIHDETDSSRSTNQAEQSKVMELMQVWEEPAVDEMDYDDEIDDGASVRNVLEFRNALAKLDKPYLLGIAWGDVSTRQKMVLNSQSVYWKLKRLSNDQRDGLKFDTIAGLCEQPDGTLHPDELKHLIGLLRPDRDGFLSLAEFVKSVDSVYKEAKLIHASVKNSEKIDREFEKALNLPFYTVVFCIILSQIGLNPLALFISLSPLILGFSWMIGSASSNMFEGWLFILIRRPYNIGDRIHIGNIESETSWDGSACAYQYYTNVTCVLKYPHI
jgi:Mechanosensitive ion channel